MTDGRFRSRMVRRSSPEGFALAELLVSVFVLAVMTVLVLSVSSFSSEAYYVFPDQFTRLKSEALLTGEKRYYEDESGMEYPSIFFWESGMINQARTLTFQRGTHEKQIVIELGTGALVFR